jgi:hypothetical protein
MIRMPAHLRVRPRPVHVRRRERRPNPVIVCPAPRPGLARGGRRWFPPSTFLDKNRWDIGKSQSTWEHLLAHLIGGRRQEPGVGGRRARALRPDGLDALHHPPRLPAAQRRRQLSRPRDARSSVPRSTQRLRRPRTCTTAGSVPPVRALPSSIFPDQNRCDIGESQQNGTVIVESGNAWRTSDSAAPAPVVSGGVGVLRCRVAAVQVRGVELRDGGAPALAHHVCAAGGAVRLNIS